jgi:mRNA-degrading endonuclease RelE of RelBE toxin-antitoxin system
MPSSHYYGFAYDRCCLDFLKTLDKKIRRQIVNKIQQLAAGPHPATAKVVQGMQDGGDTVYRIRSGDYRILYCVRGVIVCVLDIDHRKDVYR